LFSWNQVRLFLSIGACAKMVILFGQRIGLDCNWKGEEKISNKKKKGGWVGIAIVETLP
jgi:hypothetical protein